METSQDAAAEWQTQRTQEAGLDALLMARVAGIVREIDLDVAVRALKGTYDVGTLREGILNPPHLGGDSSPATTTASPSSVPGT